MTASNGPRTGRPPTRAPRGMVATSHSLASAAGVRALRQGGSAVDAAIAANAVLCAAYPHMAGLGGDGFWLVSDPGETEVRALNASGPAARNATRDYYAERGHDRIPKRGPPAALTVPGAVDGWRRAHDGYGRLAWSELFDDAVEYARNGVPVGRSLAHWLVADEDVLRERPLVGDVFRPGGERLREGDALVQENLADSLATIAKRGPRDGFYEGELAERLCESLEEKGSPLRADDFAGYTAEWVDPISTTYRGHTVYELPPNAQGFAALELLNVAEGFDVEAWGDGSADYYHLLAEAAKLALADRDAWLADPAFVDAPVDRFASKAYADERRANVDPDAAMSMGEVEPGIPFDEGARIADAGGDTCYFTVVDEDGLVVSAIESLYQPFGAGVVGGETGILLQNRGAAFSLDERCANRLEPGKRPAHTLVPAMLCTDGRPVVTFGTMGGNGQPQTHAALVTRLVDFGYDVQQAIEAPRWVVGKTLGSTSKRLWLEGRVPDSVVADLGARGQSTRVVRDWDERMGHAQAICIDRESGVLVGGADPRGDGAAIGY